VGSNASGGMILLLIGVYVFPSLIAVARAVPSRWGIMTLNLLLGWTVLGWIAALVWAFSGKAAPWPTPKSTPEASEGN
jgi:hypothetical protein